MAFDAFLKIDGIPGESLDEKHKDWIEVLGYNYGATQATSATASSSGGASSERVNLTDLTVRKFVDKSSPKLFEAVAKGQHIKEIVLNVNRAGGGEKVTYFTITLEEVVVSSIDHTGASDGDGDLPVEVVTFNFARIKTTYTQQKRSDGAGGGNVAGGWDRTLNKVYS
ncbi:type VI secretion system tube protein Hcp [Pseudomonas aeruginosa]|uniref:Hcp family type VI secretion system effector n=1 Tax=Pseudomonas aeruginosa TaxID=287 RepID=UPI00053ED368|nr:type VI secretion system tube protein Hcp [Pseudomonas aeruginosa]WCV80996.1 type VI secretion system tube protein Hcp [Pseudomonas aeruginosa]HBO0859715.1 type VI secretion system tube protein Hcp [Pseudomonas aeruginosa]HCE6879267.1 type VI secretion system tube protein Hcp [Pseudomonas aeruginosa]HDR2971469.1 type VI secretion system tube protein Hcp [Pseudomonas aeruginosa]